MPEIPHTNRNSLEQRRRPGGFQKKKKVNGPVVYEVVRRQADVQVPCYPRAALYTFLGLDIAAQVYIVEYLSLLIGRVYWWKNNYIIGGL